MSSASDYKVELGKIARTLLYEDSEGTIRFGFDFDTSGGQNILILERPSGTIMNTVSSEGGRSNEAEHSRVNVAFERTKQYLVSRGHNVKVWPDEF